MWSKETTMNEENNKLNNNKKDKILDIDPSQIDFSNPEKVKELFLMLLNAYGKVLNENTKLREDNQKLRDEINKLKGEKGKPEFKPNKNNDDFSEEDEEECNSKKKKKRKKKRDRKGKKNKIKIDRKERINFSKEEKKDLPSDIEFKGYRTIVVQGIKIITDNVELKIPRYWSPSERKSYEPKLPKQYSLGEYNAEIHAFVLMLYFIGRVTQPKIVKILNEIGTIISDNKVLDIINRDEEELSKEKMYFL